ncbi:MAG: hypothetical protein HY433_00545 [Candidatus Liptonbacteria bacterium]|nr:hypothetical protein [Candidatus Liptonbacteria bacterium]
MAVISNAWSALEGYINFIASLAKFARKLESHEMAFLEEMDWKLNDKGKFEKQTAYQSTTKKFLFLLERFSSVKIVKFNKSRIWNDMKVSEKIRNGLIHPKETIVFKDFNLETAEMTHKTAKLAILFLEKKVLKSKHSSFQS